MTLQYYISNRSAFISNPDTKSSVTLFPNDPAYALAKHFVTSNRIDDLKFFTEIGYRLILNSIEIESTYDKRSFNIHTPTQSYSSLPSMHDDIIAKISSYEVDKIISIDSIVAELKSKTVNTRIFDWLGDKIRLVENGLIAIGKYNEYLINFDNNSVYRNKNFVCIHVSSDYTPANLNEKESCILTKTLACINDQFFFPKDHILSKFIIGETK